MCFFEVGGGGGVGDYYLTLGSIQHQIIELAEETLLQLVPGDAPVLAHEEWRSKPGGGG